MCIYRNNKNTSLQFRAKKFSRKVFHEIIINVFNIIVFAKDIVCTSYKNFKHCIY